MSNFCSAPWVSRFVHPDGKVTACCFNQTTDINSLKQSFTDNQKHPTCNYCWSREATNLHSPRHDFLRANASGQDVTMLSINLGNYCNAECIMCNGNTSSGRNTWAKQHNIIEYRPHTIQEAKSVDISIYPKIETITLIGGEPAIHPKTIEILDDLIAIGKHRELTVSLNTNASRLDDRLINRLTQFNQISVTLSIDGAGDSFEYQRRPLKWDKVKTIAEQWMTISHNIVINYVVSAVSIWGFNEFVEWVELWDESINRKCPEIILTHVTNRNLSLEVLTDAQREYWIRHAHNHAITPMMINILTSTKFNPKMSEMFNIQIALEDQTAAKKFIEIVPIQ